MKLTRMLDDVSENGIASTPPGMAHWRGTGPPGTTCRTCVHFEAKVEGSYGHWKYQWE